MSERKKNRRKTEEAHRDKKKGIQQDRHGDIERKNYSERVGEKKDRRTHRRHL